MSAFSEWSVCSLPAMNRGDILDDFEVDATSVFRQEATDLTSLSNLDETLGRFGFSVDDRIDRRELVLIYRRVEKDMEAEIYRLAHMPQYDDAKEMRARLTSLRSAFDNRQTSVVEESHKDQSEFFEKASKELLHSLGHLHSTQQQSVAAECDRKRADLSRFHEIQWENLELSLSRVVKPRMKYSRRMIELFKAEDELIKMCEYEDARKVRKMIDKIKPGEEKRFDDNFDASLEARRQNLRDLQARDRYKLEELILVMVWKDIRRRDLEMSM